MVLFFSFQAAKIVKQVYSVLPVYDRIVPALLGEGVWNLSKSCTFTLGVPIGPMLAKPTKGVSEILGKFQNTVYTCEYKYDGERAQVVVHSLIFALIAYDNMGRLAITCSLNRFITWRMAWLRYTVEMLKGTLQSFRMLLRQFRGDPFYWLLLHNMWMTIVGLR